MKPSEVIMADAKKRGIDPENVIKKVHQIVHGGHGAMMHSGNTTLVLRRIAPRVFETHLFTEDSPLSLARALVEFFHKIRDKKVRRLYGKTDSTEIIDMMKQLGSRLKVEVHASDLPQYNWRIDV